MPAVSVGEMGNEQIYDKRLCRRMSGTAVSCLVFSRRYPGQEAVSDRAFRQPSAWNAISYVDGKLPYRMLPGLFLLLLAYLTSEQVGYGDGLAVLILGCFLGAGKCAAVCGTAFMLSGLFTTGKICLKKEEPVPFLPFLLGALEVVLLVE